MNDALFVVMEEIDKYNFQNFIGFYFKLRPWIYGSWLRSFNNLHSNISIHILHTVLCTFPKVLIRRICLTVKSFFKTKNFFKMKKHLYFFTELKTYYLSLTLFTKHGAMDIDLSWSLRIFSLSHARDKTENIFF